MLDALGAAPDDAVDEVADAAGAAAPGRRGDPGRRAARRRARRADRRRCGWPPRPARGSPGCRAGPASAARSRPARCPSLLPGGRPVADAGRARRRRRRLGRAVAAVGRRAATPPGSCAAAAAGDLGALVVGGVDPADLPDPAAALAALEAAPFVVSLELRASAVTDRADVVLPVAPVAEKAGTFVDWEGRGAPFAAAPCGRPAHVRPARARRARRRDGRAARACRRRARRAAELAELGRLGRRARRRARPCRPASRRGPQRGEAVLATWHLLLDDGRLQDGEPYLAGTAHAAGRAAVAATAAEIGVADGGPVTVVTDARRDHAAARRHRDARPRGLAADELAGLRRARDARRRRRRARDGHGRHAPAPRVDRTTRPQQGARA